MSRRDFVKGACALGALLVFNGAIKSPCKTTNVQGIIDHSRPHGISFTIADRLRSGLSSAGYSMDILHKAGRRYLKNYVAGGEYVSM